MGEFDEMARPPLLYVGTYSEPIRFASGTVFEGRGQGVHILRVDATAGTLAEIGVAGGARNPSYLAFDPTRRFLYAVNELKEFEGAFGGAVTAFTIDDATGGLTLLNTVPTHGTDPCHLCVDRAGRHVLVANYSSGHVTVLPILPDGSLGAASQVVAHAGSSVDPVRQTGPHLHHVATDEDGTRVFATDLGLDRVFVYRLDVAAGKLTADDPPSSVLQPGAGPRQTVLHPNGRHAYVLNELGSSVTAHARGGAGSLVPGRTVSTLPDGFGGRNHCAELQIAPSGRFLYASNRGHDSIAVFSVSPDTGELLPLGHVGTGGKTPRNFDISPSGDLLAAANQDSGTVVLFRVDTATGMLTPTGGVSQVGTPVCVRFL
jgi:6-phosphogluconolactonase